MAEQVNLSAEHKDDWALFLPAVSSFFIAGLGRQRKGMDYFPKERIPAGLNGDVECLNFLNSKQGLYNYKWGLYSAGHADLDITSDNPNESIIREREEGTFMLGDSGGFQIMKGQWPADWKDPNCPKAMKQRKRVLSWMDKYMDYGMCLDIPSMILMKTDLVDKHGITTIEECKIATHINNDYFIHNRSGACKFLNVLQGQTHTQSDEWYEEFKMYADPAVYPDNHFNGWAFGGQNKIDIHLMLRRIVFLIHDGLLGEGKHDLLHCLGTSILEYAVLFTDIQKAVRKYHNPNFMITFDCASPFFGAAKGLAYNNSTFKHNTKWTYSMEKTAENKDFDKDMRKFSDAVLAEGIHEKFSDSPVTDAMVMKDLCYRGQSFLNKHGKETKTSWDTLSYTLLQAHNVYQHMFAVQEANRQYDNGCVPAMLMNETFERVRFRDLVDEIFALNDRQKSLDLIDKHSRFWMQIMSGSQGYSGKRAVNAGTMFDELFSVEDETPINTDVDIEDSDELMQEVDE